MSYRYPTDEELLPTAAELEKQRKAAAAPGEKGAWGGALGTIAGGALGALLSVPSFGSLAPVLIPAGAGAGGAIGGAIGGSVGGAEADAAEQDLETADLERQKKLAALKLRQAALDHLEAA